MKRITKKFTVDELKTLRALVNERQLEVHQALSGVEIPHDGSPEEFLGRLYTKIDDKIKAEEKQ